MQDWSIKAVVGWSGGGWRVGSLIHWRVRNWRFCSVDWCVNVFNCRHRSVLKFDQFCKCFAGMDYEERAA
jgi:hypothetical protein